MGFDVIRQVAVFSSLVALFIGASLRAADPPLPPEQMKQANEVMEATKKIGPWENQTRFIDDATDNMFKQQNWNSEPDQFARQLMHDVGQIAPWNTRDRQEVFLNSAQQRWKLSHDQRMELDSALKQESMMFAMRHFKDVLPVALEAAKTRASNEPFTAEQVQDWSNRLRPLMDEGLQMVQRVGRRLDKSMTPEQRELLKTDMGALVHRHQDMKKLVEKWQAGQWTPADWGLQNDPIHANAMAEYRAREAEKDALVDAAQAAQKPDESTVAVNESAWDKYVKWFCNAYECDERQRGQADAILKNAKKEAIAYRAHRRDQIEQLERRAAGEKNPEKLKLVRADLARQLAPIEQIFDRLKKQLTGLLTSQQRLKFSPPPLKQAQNDMVVP
jgi:hypothetical protein